MIGVGVFCVEGQEFNPHLIGRVCCSLSMLGDMFLKGWYFGVSGFEVDEVTQGFERIFYEYPCVLAFLEPVACFEDEGSRVVLCIFS